MQFSSVFLAAAGLATMATAAPMTELETRGLTAATCAKPVAGLTAADCNILAGLGVFGMGTSSGTSVSSKGPNTWNIMNKSGKDIIIVAWGASASWVNVKAPDVTYSLASGASVTLSTPNGYQGAMSAIYGSSTKLVNGQISNTWLEFNTAVSGVIDVSREVNTAGNTLAATITSSTKQQCTTDFTKCYFACTGSVPSCWLPYDAKTQPNGFQLYNCPNKGKDGAADSGGCAGFGTGGAHVDVTWS